jgi:hypothetical protein
MEKQSLKIIWQNNCQEKKKKRKKKKKKEKKERESWITTGREDTYFQSGTVHSCLRMESAASAAACQLAQQRSSVCNSC